MAWERSKYISRIFAGQVIEACLGRRKFSVRGRFQIREVLGEPRVYEFRVGVLSRIYIFCVESATVSLREMFVVSHRRTFQLRSRRVAGTLGVTRRV